MNKSETIKRINILGLGVSGVATAELAISKGLYVNAIDQGSSDLCKKFMKKMLGNEQITFFTDYIENYLPEADEIIISPGIKPHSYLGQLALNSNIEIVGELEFALRYLEIPYVAITGTNGKTTTTEMTGSISKYSGLRTLLAGNIGLAASEAVLLQFDYDIVIFEVSSFQLEFIKDFKPLAAVILNIDSDHIDWHGSFDAYQQAKFKMFSNSNSASMRIINYDLLSLYSELNTDDNVKAITFSLENINADVFYNSSTDLIQASFMNKDLKLKGDVWAKHNIENLLAAIALSSSFINEPEKLNCAVSKLISNFSPAPHRQEIIASKNDVLYVNDSKATNPAALIAAVQAFSKRDKDICLIAGGLDKNMDFSNIIKLKNKIKAVFLIGDSKKALVSLWNYDIHCILCNSFEESVLQAASHAKQDEIVLLSPACASMDMFENYKERGDVFRSIVLNDL